MLILRPIVPDFWRSYSPYLQTFVYHYGEKP